MVHPVDAATAKDVDVVVYVIAEVVKPEDADAIAAARAVRCWRCSTKPIWPARCRAGAGDGPIAAARTRCAQFSALVGVPVEPMIGLLAVAALDGLDDASWAALQVLAAHPGGLDSLDGSFDGFLAADNPLPADVRLRLLDTLDLFGTALGVAAVRQGRTPAQVAGPAAADERRRRRPQPRSSPLGAEVRYRRVLDAVAELEALAVSRDEIAERISGVPVPRRHRGRADGRRRRPGRGRRAGRRAMRRAGRTPAAGGAMAALQPRTGQRSAPRLRRGYRQGIVAAVVADLRVTAGAARGAVVSDEDGDGSGRPGGRAGGRDRPPAGSARHQPRDVVLVTGPWMAGVSGVVAALRERLPQHKFVESTELGPGDAPTAVVFVVSAAAHLTESDCALLDAAAEHTDVVIGVVAKIDVHRTWRDVLAANRDALAAHAPRYAQVPWVGAAAAPELGEPHRRRLGRHRLGATRRPGRSRDETGCGRGNPGCRRSRSGSIATPRAPVGGPGSTRCAKSAARPCGSDASRNPNGTITLRGQIQQARVQLSYFARNRCSSVRGELQEDAARAVAAQHARLRGAYPRAGRSRWSPR